MGRRETFDEDGYVEHRKSTRRATKNPPQSVKEKFAEQRREHQLQVEAKTENQAKAIRAMKQNQVVILRGSSGTGKSFLACTHAANRYQRGEVKRIVLVRPYEHVGRSIGLRPGTGDEKLRPLMQSMLESLEKVFGKAHMEAKIAEGTIILEALEDVRGRSYANSVVILDEGQNADKSAMKALLTRLEETSQLIICGDGKQKDTKSDSGIDWAVNLIEKVRKEKPSYLNEADMHNAYNNFGVITFTNDDIVRSGMTALMVKIFDEEGV